MNSDEEIRALREALRNEIVKREALEARISSVAEVIDTTLEQKKFVSLVELRTLLLGGT